MILSILLNLFFLIFHKFILVVLPVICVIDFLPPVQDALLGLQTYYKTISYTLGFNFVLLYVFMWISFQGFSELFTLSVIDKDNNELPESEPFCYSSIQCLLLFWSNGFFSSGTNDLTDLLSFKNHPGLFFGMFFYNMVAFIVINTIFANIFTGLIADAFNANREQTEHDEDDRDNVCYICDLTRYNASLKGIDFEDHTHQHNVTRYVEFLVYLFIKNKDDFTIQEKFIYDLIMKNDITWIPYEGDNDDDDDD